VLNEGEKRLPKAKARGHLNTKETYQENAACVAVAKKTDQVSNKKDRLGRRMKFLITGAERDTNWRRGKGHEKVPDNTSMAGLAHYS